MSKSLILFLLNKDKIFIKFHKYDVIMTDKAWRKDLDILIDENLNELIRETKEYDYAIKNAKDKSKAQLWIAIAILNNKINSINMLKNSNYDKKIPKDELDSIIKTLETL